MWFYKGRGEKPTASFTYIHIIPWGKNREEDCAAGSPPSTSHVFAAFTYRVCIINIRYTEFARVSLVHIHSRHWWSGWMLRSLFTLAAVKAASQPVTNVQLKRQKDSGMAPVLHEINLPKIYRPTLKPKRKNAASTYSHSPLFCSWL